MLRRTFLKLLAAAGAAAARPAAGQDRPPRVVVVGAGPAGFSAALELIERGVDVHLIEAEAQVGGKVKGWTETLGDAEVDVEHGIHGWWHQYVHFTELLKRYGLDGALNPPDKRGVYRWPGGEIDANSLSGLNQFARLFKAEALSLGYAPFATAYRDGMRWLRGLTVDGARQAIGGLSVAEFHARGAPLTLWRTFARIASHSMYFLPPEEIDAAEYALAEQFYFAGGSRNLRCRWLRGNPQSLIWEPLAEAFVAQGGRLSLATRVAEVVVERGRVIGVRTGDPLPGVKLDDVPAGWTQVDREGLPPVFVFRDELHLTAFSGRCTHAGCPLTLVEDGFACPCHGGRFDAEGRPTAGPPREPLTRLFVDQGADGVHVEGEGLSDLIPADAVILALDVPGLQKVAGDLLPEVRTLSTCRETVARFWLDRDVPEGIGHACMFTDLPHASNGFLLHRLQDRARAWAAQTGGAVIEIQAYRDIPTDADREALLDLIEADLRAAWPELAEATVLKRTLTDGRTFTRFAPGWYAGALPVETAVPGLLLAGDHVHIERNCHFMEKAVTTGRLAANAVLRDHGRPLAPILPERR
ncbi:MAG: FAD-dependent oxidoreductase [Alphaproteobacteria bacterium]|nr:FAD-dependent oxidoreductase [Alphaproteobacteria bacterium]